MNLEGVFRRRRLPHWDVDEHPVFITACLDGSISAAGLSRLRKYREKLDARTKPPEIGSEEWEQRKLKLVFQFVDELLDFQSPVQHLADVRQAKIVENAFLHFAGVRYRLLAYVVMPSHHHWLFLPDEQWAMGAVSKTKDEHSKLKTAREIISHSVQSYTATMCNRVRGKTGAYWQTETYDRWARDDDEMFRIIEYIENNPVKAGLIASPELWQWSSARLRSELGLRPGDAIRLPK